MRFLLLITYLILNTTAYADSAKLNNTWLLSRDHILDGKLKLLKTDEINLELNLSSHLNKFSGKYININNDSLFIGEILNARKTTLINFFQYDKSFYVIHNGYQVSPNHYFGTWFASGNLSGEFELKKK